MQHEWVNSKSILSLTNHRFELNTYIYFLANFIFFLLGDERHNIFMQLLYINI